MTKISFKVTERESYTIVHFELEGNITPEVLRDLKPPKVDGVKGVILSGRGPLWLYCGLTHYYHPTKFIATYDPRLNGGVVVESHTPEHEQGDVIRMEPN